MVDFHTHILPGMDDGSRSLRQSLILLRMERELGVDTVVLTPHFYSAENDPPLFLERRARAWEELSGHLGPGAPRLLLGAEVQYFDNMDNAEEIGSLCIGSTGVLLLEMPFRPWDERIVRTVLELNGRENIRVVLAHIERYASFCPDEAVWARLRENGILMQVNCSLFSGLLGRNRGMRLFRRGRFQLLGSDCHDPEVRRPNWSLVPEPVLAAAAKNAGELLQLP